MTILIVEDDLEAGAFLARNLINAGYAVETARDGREGLALCDERSYDLVIVDRMLPGLDGLQMVERLRRMQHTMPVLFLSALDEVDDRVAGLRAGGDDYLTKPYAFVEALARIEALLRRQARLSDPAALSLLQVGDLEMDLLKRTVRRGNKSIVLHPREFRLLEYFIRHAGQVVTRSMLLEAVWDYRFDPQTNVIDVHISRLRRKIEDGFAHPLIRTVRGTGYVLDPAD